MPASLHYADTFEGMAATLLYYRLPDIGLITQAVLSQGDFEAIRDYFLSQVAYVAEGASEQVNLKVEDFIHVLSTASGFSSATASYGIKVLDAMAEDAILLKVLYSA